MKKPLLVIIFVSIAQFCFAQPYFQQYFDGEDTAAFNSIFIQMDPAPTNVWQIGKPHKTIFSSAFTVPNVIVTDTSNAYPVNNTSSFTFDLYPGAWWTWGIIGIQWSQKLDLQKKHDGAIVEYSLNHGPWTNVFNNPTTYNFYGFDPANVDTLNSGEYAFSGTDSTWKDIWLCFDASFYTPSDTLKMRYTLKTDSVNTNQEGWMMDNFGAHLTIMHTAKSAKSEKYLKVYPTTTTGVVHIEAEKLLQYHIIESIELIDMAGKVAERFGKSPTKYFIDIGRHNPGIYYLKVTTNVSTETFPIILTK